MPWHWMQFLPSPSHVTCARSQAMSSRELTLESWMMWVLNQASTRRKEVWDVAYQSSSMWMHCGPGSSPKKRGLRIGQGGPMRWLGDEAAIVVDGLDRMTRAAHRFSPRICTNLQSATKAVWWDVLYEETVAREWTSHPLSLTPHEDVTPDVRIFGGRKEMDHVQRERHLHRNLELGIQSLAPTSGRRSENLNRSNVSW